MFDDSKKSGVLACFSDRSSKTPSLLLCEKFKDFQLEESNPIFQLHEKDCSLHIGDVILIEPSGQGTILFDTTSTSNAIFLTERCNSRCVICPQPPQSDGEDYVDVALKTISLLDIETDVLGITGGEPTLAWDGLMEVLKACEAYIPQTTLQLLTNAKVLKDYEKAHDLVSTGGKKLIVCIPLYADISILHDQIVRSKGAFWETLEGIYNLARFNVPIELRNVITKMNYTRLPQWSEFVYKNLPFINHVAFMGLEPFGLAWENIDHVWIDPLDYVEQLEQSIKILHRRNMKVSLYNHQLCTIPKNLWRFSCKSISEWKNKYFPICDQCKVRMLCGGFFDSADNIKSRGIQAITDETLYCH